MALLVAPSATTIHEDDFLPTIVSFRQWRCEHVVVVFLAYRLPSTSRMEEKFRQFSTNQCSASEQRFPRLPAVYHEVYGKKYCR
jgi:hypothetical protein